MGQQWNKQIPLFFTEKRSAMYSKWVMQCFLIEWQHPTHLSDLYLLFFLQKKYNYSNLYINQIKLLQKLFKIIIYKKISPVHGIVCQIWIGIDNGELFRSIPHMVSVLSIQAFRIMVHNSYGYISYR